MKVCIGCNQTLPYENFYKWNRFCKPCHAKKSHEWWKSHKIDFKIYQRSWRLKIKSQVMSGYGNECSCCGESIIEFLTIDHVNSNGREHVKRLGGTLKFYQWLIEKEFPKGFRILCWNCNCGRRLNFDVCPHKGIVNRPIKMKKSKSIYLLREKEEAVV